MKSIKFIPQLFLIIITGATQAQIKKTITDPRDRKVYQIVKIGLQTWMAENLSAATFRNGDAIAEAKTNEEWKKAAKEGKPAWCYYNNDPANDTKYGKLYNWYAENDPRGLAPVGWHIPNDAEWTVLTDYLGGANIAGIKMKATNGWISIKNTASNTSGFTALPGGYRDDEGPFKNIDYGGWWGLAGDTKEWWFHRIFRENDDVGGYHYAKASGFSIRCVKD